jgi:two-component system sensor histidine kinase/response regulator
MKKQILIVEDEHDCAELLSYHLQKEDYQTVIARNGEEAIDAVQCQTPDAVLLDVMMPELNGWEVCRILRGSTKGRSLPIIMLTALSDEEERVKGLSLGADDYLAKPYSMKELLLKIKKHIELHQTIKQLETRGQEQDTALKCMIHEMRNAMTVIGGYSAIALRKEDPSRYLKPIKKAALHAESLLNDASLIAQLEKSGGYLPTQPLNIADLIEEVVDMVHDSAAKRQIELAVKKSASPLVSANRTAVRQVLLNLLSNAIKYNRDGGRIWISFAEGPDSLRVVIQDEGNGINCGELHKIFDKFYRAAGSEGVKGTGLGLFIVKLLTEAMGGTVTVSSQPGLGSTFTVSLVKAEAVTLQSV